MNIKNTTKRIFRLITLIDWIFIILGFLVFFGFYFFFKREVAYVTAQFRVTDENVLYAMNNPNNEFAHSFVKGDTQKDGLGRISAEILDVRSYNIRPDQQVVYLRIKLKAVYNPRTNKYSVQGKDIVFGESLMFSFSKVQFKAIVVDFPGFQAEKNIKQQKTIVKTQLRNDSRYFSDTYGVPEFLANAIKKDDTVSDTQGNTLIRVIDVEVSPAKRLVLNSTGQPNVLDDPYLKDVYITLELTTKEINGQLYMFDYIPVLINTLIPINTHTVSIWPTITEIIQ